jgi:uncharacterized cupin superfamily protein
VNVSVVRVGVIEGEYHWHKHQNDDEFFYVVDGQLLIDLEGRTSSTLRKTMRAYFVQHPKGPFTHVEVTRPTPRCG